MILVNNVTKQFKQHFAVDQLNLHISQGEYVALLGPNGAGKTTLVEMIEGLQTPTQGSITIQGMNWQQHANQLRQFIGLSLQETKFVDKLTVHETLKLFASFYNLSSNRVKEILHWVRLEEKLTTYTVNLSGGQRQRLALGISLLNKPQLLLLDEPTTGLDPNSRRELWDILLNLKKEQQTTLILTTHYMEEAEKLCSRIVIMDKGRILADGKLQDLLAKFSKGEIIDFVTDKPLNSPTLAGLLHFTNITVDGDSNFSGSLLVEHITSFLPLFFNHVASQGIQLLQIQARKKTLDDLFVEMTGRKLSD